MIRRSCDNILMAGGPKNSKRHPQNQPPPSTPSPPPVQAGEGKKKRRTRGNKKQKEPDAEEEEEVEFDFAELMKKLSMQNQTPVMSYPAVIKVLVTMQEPDYESPWQMVITVFNLCFLIN